MNKLHYVYTHFDPRTGEILYVGMGTNTRAYYFGTRPSDNYHYGYRSNEHSYHLAELYEVGYLPHEWVRFEAKYISKEDARSLEKKLIEELFPKYNRKAGIKQLKFNKEEVLKIKELRAQGLYYHQIAEQMGCSTMVAYRILNGQSPRYKEFLNIGE